ncbi:syntaxin-72-like [Pyrus communis]|uniref:syntaxin-72-like n=1 Tax=Pyrus communis TaxID=23211 RepID=UPI0035C0C222
MGVIGGYGREKRDKKTKKVSVINILSRVDSLCKKYDKYELKKHRDLNPAGEDAFACHYTHVDSEIRATLMKAKKKESNRAVAVAMYVEIRRTMARLMEELPMLRKLAFKFHVKGLSPEELETRSDLVFALPERIPDGTETAAKKAGEWGTSTSHKNIKFDSSVFNECQAL